MNVEADSKVIEQSHGLDTSINEDLVLPLEQVNSDIDGSPPGFRKIPPSVYERYNQLQPHYRVESKNEMLVQVLYEEPTNTIGPPP